MKTYKLTFTDKQVGSPQYGKSAECVYSEELGNAITQEQVWEVIQALVDADFQVTFEVIA